MAINYNRQNRTYHAEVDRAERIAMIEATLGLTNIVIEVMREKNNKPARVGITTNGVVVVRNLTEDKIVTAYVAEEWQAENICKQAGKKCVPPKLLARVRKNVERHPELFYL